MKTKWVTIIEKSVKTWKVEVPDGVTDEAVEEAFYCKDYESSDPNASYFRSSDTEVSDEKPADAKLLHDQYIDWEP